MKKKIKFKKKECSKCERRLEKALKKLEGIEYVSVDCENGVCEVEVTAPIEDVIFYDLFDAENYEIIVIE